MVLDLYTPPLIVRFACVFSHASTRLLQRTHNYLKDLGGPASKMISARKLAPTRADCRQNSHRCFSNRQHTESVIPPSRSSMIPSGLGLTMIAHLIIRLDFCP